MKTKTIKIEKNILVPTTEIVDKVIYVAEDNIEFDTIEACEKYELKLLRIKQGNPYVRHINNFTPEFNDIIIRVLFDNTEYYSSLQLFEITIPKTKDLIEKIGECLVAITYNNWIPPTYYKLLNELESFSEGSEVLFSFWTEDQYGDYPKYIFKTILIVEARLKINEAIEKLSDIF